MDHALLALEKKDLETLGDPENTILRKGGHIFMVYAVVMRSAALLWNPWVTMFTNYQKWRYRPGCVATGSVAGCWGVRSRRPSGAKSLFLASNTKLNDAVHLYESVDFRHVPSERAPPVPYTRANVFMEVSL